MFFNRRTFLQTVSTMGGAALTHGLLVACSGRGPMANGAGAVNLLWSDVTNAYAPLLADMTNAPGIKILQTIVPYNQRLDKINTAVLGGADVDVVQMDTVWTAQFAAADWVDDLTDRVPKTMVTDIPASALSAVMYRGRLYGIPVFNSA